MLKSHSKLRSSKVKFMSMAVSQRHGVVYGKREGRDGFEIKRLIPNISNIAEET